MVVCVVDDDPVFQFLAKKQFQRCSADISVLSFPNGQEAYEYFASMIDKTPLLPRVVLIDINMPFMNGWQLVTKMQEMQIIEYTDVYMVSSSLSKEDITLSSSKTGVKDYLVKPIYQKRYEEIHATAQNKMPQHLRNHHL